MVPSALARAPLSRGRVRLGLRPRGRMLGAWKKAADDTAEPARTERLLRGYLCAIRHSRSSDCQESMSLNLMSKATGGTLVQTGHS